MIMDMDMWNILISYPRQQQQLIHLTSIDRIVGYTYSLLYIGYSSSHKDYVGL